MAPHTFGALLRRRRQHADLTIEGLAHRSGVSERTISDIERGMSAGPQRRTVLALANALQLAGPDRAEFLGAARPGRRGAVSDSLSVSVHPIRLSDFSGRAEEMTALLSLLDAGAPSCAVAILLSGSAGVGKTTLALEALHRTSIDPTALLFVNLQGLDTLPLSPLEVLQALLRQTAASEEPLTLDDALAAWRRACASHHLSVVLDNVSSEKQVRPVLAAAGDTRVLMTSRRSLAGLESIHRLVISPFSRAAGIAFLARTVSAPQQEDGDLGELSSLCSDLPLALRIAANRLASRPAWSVADLVRRLSAEGTRLRQLVAGDLRIEPAFALSYDALSPASRQVFRGLALIPGASFRADMVASIAERDVQQTDEVLEELADLALVEPLSGGRYRIHDLLRLFAQDRLATADGPEEIAAQRLRLRGWVLDTARSMASVKEEDEKSPIGVDIASAREWLVTEADTWLAALHDAADGTADALRTVLTTAKALLTFAERWLAFPHWRAVAEISVTAAERLGDDAAVAEQLHMSAALELAFFDADPDRARTLALRSLDATVDSGSVVTQMWALVTLAWSEVRRDETAAALDAAGRALTTAVEIGHAHGEVQGRYWIAVSRMADDPDEALRQARLMRVALDERASEFTVREWNVSKSLVDSVLAKALLRLHRYAEVIDLADEIIDAAALFPHEPDFLARAHRHRGFGHLGSGEVDLARADLQLALDLVQEHERPAWWADEIQSALDSLLPDDPDTGATARDSPHPAAGGEDAR